MHLMVDNWNGLCNQSIKSLTNARRQCHATHAMPFSPDSFEYWIFLGFWHFRNAKWLEANQKSKHNENMIIMHWRIICNMKSWSICHGQRWSGPFGRPKSFRSFSPAITLQTWNILQRSKTQKRSIPLHQSSAFSLHSVSIFAFLHIGLDKNRSTRLCCACRAMDAMASLHTFWLLKQWTKTQNIYCFFLFVLLKNTIAAWNGWSLIGVKRRP